MDSLVNRYTSDRKIRSEDAYTPNAEAGKRPDRAVTVYAQRAREAYPGTPIVIGSIEASLRRIAHYDYWSDKVRRSVLPDSKADILLFGNAERALVALTHRLAAGEPIESIRDLRGTAFMVKPGWRPADEWHELDSLRARQARPHRRPSRPLRHGAGGRRAQARRRRRPAGAHRAGGRAPGRAPRRPRTHGDPPAVLRAGQGRPGDVRPRLAGVPPRIQPGQRARDGAVPRRRPRRARRVDQPAAGAADHARDGLRATTGPMPAHRTRATAARASRPGT